MATEKYSALPRQATRSRRHWLLGMPALAGIVFSLSWVVGLSIFSASTDVHSTGADLAAAYAGHQAVAATQFLLTEGVPAVAFALVIVALARAAATAGERRLGRTILASGLGAAAISLVLCVLGFYLVGSLIPDHRLASAASLNDTINRLDGVKMFMLAASAVAAFAVLRRGRLALPRWLAYVSLALAATIAVSGVGYLFLLGAPALAAWVSLPLLLVWVTGIGVVLGHRDRGARRAEDQASDAETTLRAA